ncbi:MAG: cyclase family protein, partial [Actinomycetota bacterium]
MSNKIIDVTVPLSPDVPVWPGDPVFRLEFTQRMADGQPCNLSRMSLGSHAGTHVDAPFHFEAEGERLEDVGLDRFVGPAVIADVTGHGDREPIGWDVLSPYADRIRPGTILVIRTGWSERFYGTERYYEHPYLTAAACERVLEAGVRTLAIDALNPDETVVDGSEERWDV